MINDKMTSLIRTYAPMLAGWLISLPAARPILDAVGLGDTPAATAAVATLLGAAWYGLARLLEHYWPKAGILLGVPVQPAYAAPVTAAVGSLLDVPDTADPLEPVHDPSTPGASKPAAS